MLLPPSALTLTLYPPLENFPCANWWLPTRPIHIDRDLQTTRPPHTDEDTPKFYWWTLAIQPPTVTLILFDWLTEKYQWLTLNESTQKPIHYMNTPAFSHWPPLQTDLDLGTDTDQLFIHLLHQRWLPNNQCKNPRTIPSAHYPK